MALSKMAGRKSKLNTEVLNETDANGDFIFMLCKPGPKENEATCIFCSKVIHCSHHGVSAVKRHATNKQHIEACKQHRDELGALKKPATTQSLLEFCLPAKSGIPEADRVTLAETYFVLGVAIAGIPYSWGDTATSILPLMFADSKVAKEFQCGRKKVSYIVSDGLGPYFKKAVIDELNKEGVYYTIEIDEPPLPEQRCRQLDIIVRYFSEVRQQVVAEHLCSFHLGSATSDVLLARVKEAIQDLPQKNMLCFYSDGPNVMKCLKKKLKQDVNPTLLNIGECSLHKIHNGFAKGIDAFGSNVESTLLDTYHFFKNSAVQSAVLKENQRYLGLPQSVFLRHVSSRWLTLGPALDRFIEQYPALKSVVLNAQQGPRAGGKTIYKRLRENLCKKDLLATALFLRNVADLFVGFLKLFQRSQPLVHVLYEEMVKLSKKVLGRFVRIEAYRHLTGQELQSVDVKSSNNWKEVIEIGGDTERAISGWSAEEKKLFRLGARSFYIKCASYLLSTLPLDNIVLRDLGCLQPNVIQEESSVVAFRNLAQQVPQVITPQEISALMDELALISTEKLQYDLGEQIDDAWQRIFVLKDKNGGPRYPLLGKLVKSLLCLSHGNADVERGFSENRRLLQERSNLSIESINGLRAIQSFSKRYDRDIATMPIKSDMIKAVKQSYKRYRERMAREDEQAAKRTKCDIDCSAAKPHEKQDLNAEINVAKKMLSNAEVLIAKGMKAKAFADIASGQALLNEGQARLAEALHKLEASKKSVRGKPL
ncbi:hypothetical protein MTO96_047997 [Rhipicephalus appendiculatus]